VASLFVQIQPGLVERALGTLNSKEIYPVKRYDNLSALMGYDVWLFSAPASTPIRPLAATTPGVVYMEPDEEHNYADDVISPDQGYWREVAPFGTEKMALGQALGWEYGYLSALPDIMDMIGAPLAHRRGILGHGVVVLVVDGGVDGARIPDKNKFGGWTDADDGDPWVDDFGHGTMVALIVLAVAPEASIYSVRLRPGPNGGIMKESVLSALDAFIPVVQADPGLLVVMNNSWGTPGCIGEAYW